MSEEQAPAETKTKEKIKLPKQSTGLPFLDQILGGGFPTKSIVCFLTDPTSGAEMFLYQFSSTRKTYYLTTVRRPEDIIRVMKDLNLDSRNIKFMSETEAKYMPGKCFANINADPQPGVNVVVDSFSFHLKESPHPEKIRKLLDVIRDVTINKDAITILSIYKSTHPKELENMILNTADVILDVESHSSGEKHETIMSIPKIHGMSPIGKIRVTFGEKIKIDTAREIA